MAALPTASRPRARCARASCAGGSAAALGLPEGDLAAIRRRNDAAPALRPLPRAEQDVATKAARAVGRHRHVADLDVEEAGSRSAAHSTTPPPTRSPIPIAKYELAPAWIRSGAQPKSLA